MHNIYVGNFENVRFTVAGEPRDIMDPANRLFLEALGRGECPPELAPADQNTPININLVRRGQAYEAPAKPRHVAFSGGSRTLAGTSHFTQPVKTQGRWHMFGISVDPDLIKRCLWLCHSKYMHVQTLEQAMFEHST